LIAILNILLIAALLLAGCSGPPDTPTPTPPRPEQPTETGGPEPTAELTQDPTDIPAEPTADPEEEPLYLALVWHQHQPLYYKDEAGVYTRPWVRVHATKDYYDMASIVQNYPEVHLTYNLTPVLMRQLDDFALNEAKDLYWTLAEKPAAELSEEDKRFILERFFDANQENLVNRFPRYAGLLEKRGGSDPEQIEAALTSFTEEDFRDLQVWFNLAWFDPDFLETEPLNALVEKGQGFTEEDKTVLFAEARRIIQEVIPLHKELQDSGQIEITTTPYAHPILPLVYDTDLAAVGDPEAELPAVSFSYPNDAIAHLERSVEIYQEHFGRAPAGLWPGEGAVAEEIVSLVSKAGYRWMATSEQVLAASLDIGAFTRDANDTVQEASQLYRPYFVQGRQGEPVMMIFRDVVLSDKVGFEYSNTPGEEAAQDFIDRLEAIRARLAEQGSQGPHLVSVILDGENAWEHYPNDGEDFLNALYQKLAESETIKTVTPAEFLELYPEGESLEELYPGSWHGPNYEIWIGEQEEKVAWEYLQQVREDLAKYDIEKRKTAPSPEALQQALDYIYLAEGSDWFWWFGSDQESGQDFYFDVGFRALLANVYTSLGEEPPVFVYAPIIPERAQAPTTGLSGTFTPLIDGRVDPAEEWAKAGSFQAVGGTMARDEDLVRAFYYGLDNNNLYLRADAKSSWVSLQDAKVGFYLSSPRLGEAYPYSHLAQGAGAPNPLGFRATNLIEVSLGGGQEISATLYTASEEGWTAVGTPAQVGMNGEVLELGVPLNLLGELEAGDDLRGRVVISQGEREIQALPAEGLAQVIVPDLGLGTVVLEVSDVQGDDNGPGNYTYPADPLFEAGAYDLKSFTVAYDDQNLVFKFEFYGPVPNPWNSPNNLAIQTLDVYVDQDPEAGTGARLLLPGRNAALTEGNGWEYAVWAEGWTPQFIAPDESGEPKQVSTVNFRIIVDPAASVVTLRVPRAAFGDGDPAAWGYAALVLSQEGFPSPGVWRVRDGQETAEQYKFGGVPAGAANYPRIFDLADSGDQAQQLAFTPSPAEVGSLQPEDFAQILLLMPASR
jgi:alpha-amylase/alpha-mannosidase (GH57 family)